MKVTFGDIRFDSETRQLWRCSEEIRLTRKAFELLAFLLELRPNAVSKEDIHARLWPDAFVSEASLQSLISEIRDAIGDDARKSSFIRTVYGFGYAFSGTVVGAWETRPETQARVVRAWLIGDLGRVPVFDGENVLGRTGPDVIEFDSTTVSRRHARIEVGDQATIEDLGSKNGTYVDEQRVTGPVRLADGNRIRVGSFLLTFRVVSAADSTETQTTTGVSRRD